MKKFLILLLICIISLSLFACDIPPTDTTTDTDTNVTDAPIETDYIKTSFTAQLAKEEYFYPRINYDLGSYKGTDMPASFGVFYKVVKSYDKFSELFKNSNFLEKETLDNNYVLIIQKNYPSYPSFTEFGFSNFRIENEKAYIDLKSHHFYMVNTQPAEYRNTECYLIPNTISCEEKNFSKLNVNENDILCYYFKQIEPENIPLETGEALIFNKEQFEKFKIEYKIDFYCNDDEAFYIVIHNSKDVITFENLELNGNKLTIESNIYENESDKISIVEILRDGYESFEATIPNDVTLEIKYTENHARNYFNEVTEDEWLNAFNNYYEDNYTENVRFSYAKDDTTIIENAMFWITDDIYGEALGAKYQFYQDFKNECYYEIENKKWIKKDGVLLNDYLAFMGYNIESLKNAYSQASFSVYSGYYTLNEYNGYENIRIKITDGRIVYISFSQPSIYQENSNDRFIIYRYDFGTTKINLPKNGEYALFTETAIKRAEKVNINLDYHHSYMDKVEEETEDKTKHYAGYICINQNGNEYIAYAPNVNSYYTAITIDENPNSMEEVYSKIYRIENEYFDDSPEYTKIDIIEIGNIITIYFPNFDSYFECQEYMLDTLSQIEAVKSIDVGYIEAQDTNTMNFETYETIVLRRDRFETDFLCASYEDLKFACRNMKMPENITEETFNEYYVFIVNSYDYRNKVSDAKLVGNTVYLTNNRYYTPNTLEDAIERSCSFVVLVPKAKLGDLPEIVTVKTMLARIIEGPN